MFQKSQHSDVWAFRYYTIRDVILSRTFFEIPCTVVEVDSGFNLHNNFNTWNGLTGPTTCQGDATLGLTENYVSSDNVVRYTAGQTYRLAWPAKNHVAATCSNRWNPDHGLRLLAFRQNENSLINPIQTQFEQTQVPASFSDDPHVAGVIDFKGFQNCPKFCENMDKALCHGTFTIPSSFSPGLYTFQWNWVQGQGSTPYVTCWEGWVDGSSGSDTSTSTTTTSQASSTQVETTPSDASTSSSSSPVTTCAEAGVDYAGYDLNSDGQPSTENAADCQARCYNEPLCNFWSFNTQWNGCYLKTSDAGRYSNANRISGPKTCTVASYGGMISTQWCRDHEDRMNICDGGLDSCWIDGMNLCDQEGERCFGVMINQFFTPNNHGVKLCLSDVLVDKGDWLVRMKTDADASSTTLTNSATDSPLENAPASTVRCGSSWVDANGKCGTPCPSRSDAECTNGERCYADLSVLPCDNGSTTSTTSTASNSPVNPTGEMCVHHSVMTCINNVSTYWPKCDPSQTKTNSGPSGYEFGHYCTEEWADAFNEMMSSPQVNKCHDREVVKRTLAQIAFETGYFSTVYQPLDGGAGLIHMIPANWVINAADMDDIFNTGSSFETAARTMGKNFFQDHRYGWKSVAAWFLSTNRVISTCGKNLFEASYSEMTRCILSRESDRSEVYQHVAQCMDAYDSANPETSSTSSTSTSTTTTTTTSGNIATENPSANELCSSGISSDDICCNASCGACGGDGCGGRPGGGSQCCAGSIRSSGNICEDPLDVACVISNHEEVTELPTREPTEEPSISATPIPESTFPPECGNGFEVYSPFGSTTCSANHVKQSCPDGGIDKNGCFLNGFSDCENLCRSHADCAFFFYNDVDWCALHTSCSFTREANNPGITCTKLITSTSTTTTSQASSTQVETTSSDISTSSSYSPVTTCAETGFDYAGFDINSDGQPSTENAAECQARCFNEPLCNFWTFNTQWNGCYLKTSDTGRYSNANRISGPKTCTGNLPTNLLHFKQTRAFEHQLERLSGTHSV